MKAKRFLILVLLALLAGCGAYREIDPNYSEDIADFSFMTQDEEELSLADLEGKWWVANFIFTNCEDVCLPMTYHMSMLQDQLKENDLDVHLVSFSVDPDYDSPEVMKEFAADYDVDYTNWSFLTGYDFETIRELSIKSFRSPVQEPKRGSDQVLHGTAFMLVTPDGKMIKSYNGLSAAEMDVIVEDLNTLRELDKF